MLFQLGDIPTQRPPALVKQDEAPDNAALIGLDRADHAPGDLLADQLFGLCLSRHLNKCLSSYLYLFHKVSTENLKLFSERVRSRRKELRLTLQQVADAVGLSVGAVAAWERAENFPKREAEKPLAGILKANPKWLLAREDADSSEDTSQQIKVLAGLCDKPEAEFLAFLVKKFGMQAATELRERVTSSAERPQGGSSAGEGVEASEESRPQ